MVPWNQCLNNLDNALIIKVMIFNPSFDNLGVAFFASEISLGAEENIRLTKYSLNSQIQALILILVYS